jgi:hypothetical protein
MVFTRTIWIGRDVTLIPSKMGYLAMPFVFAEAGLEPPSTTVAIFV